MGPVPATRASTHIKSAPIVLFDGFCQLCNGTVNWIIARDRQGEFRFASLQSSAGRRLLADVHFPANGGETMILLHGQRCFTRSTAALTIARMLPWPWRMLWWARLIPRPIRDAVYDLIARNRYRWFGRRDTCRVPTPELKGRFLD